MVKDGFPNERMVVVPRPVVVEALERALTRRLVVTDAGLFPRAAGHARERPRGASQAIVLVCVAGEGWIDLRGVRQRVPAGSAVIIAPGQPHAYGASRADPWTIWWCHVQGTDVPDLLAVAAPPRERPVLALRNTDRVISLLDEVVSAMERDHTPARLIQASGAAFKLLTQLAVDRLAPEQGDPLERAMRYLTERLDGGVRVPELAAMVGVSPSHLGALFREATGGGVLAYHTARRMARARQLLDTSRLGIKEIALEVGYPDPFYFSRQFRRTHGVSPLQYRQQHTG